MISYSYSETDSELMQILDLQQKNLAINLSKDEIYSQGFVTVVHSLSDLKTLNSIEKHIIAKEDNSVVGYILAMTEESKLSIPILIPMFELFQKVLYKSKPISSYNYIVVGQVCIEKTHRGKGLFDQGYHFYKDQYKGKFDFAITEIATKNIRSLKAHARIGFTEIHRYFDESATEWSIVIWDW